MSSPSCPTLSWWVDALCEHVPYLIGTSRAGHIEDCPTTRRVACLLHACCVGCLLSGEVQRFRAAATHCYNPLRPATHPGTVLDDMAEFADSLTKCLFLLGQCDISTCGGIHGNPAKYVILPCGRVGSVLLMPQHKAMASRAMPCCSELSMLRGAMHCGCVVLCCAVLPCPALPCRVQ